MTNANTTLRRLDVTCCRWWASLLLLGLWAVSSATWAKNLPSPAKTWEAQQALRPGAVREARRAGPGHPALHLVLAGAGGEGYALALLIGTPLGFFLGSSKLFAKSFDPIIQMLRPVSPLAWLPLGLVLFEKSDPAALFTIAICAMWPTVLNTALGVRAIPQDYLNVARVLKLSRSKTLFKVLLPATLPYMFTGFRLSLGIAWLVIVAAEMLTGAPGRRRLPLAGVQQPDLRAHHPLHPHDRRRRLRARSADERGRAADCEPTDADGIPRAEQRRQGLRPQGRPQRGAGGHQPRRRRAASSSPSSATRAPARRR